MKKLIIKSTAKVIIIATIMIILSSLAQSPVITNEIALGQMRNTTEGFVVWEIFNKVKPIINLVLCGIGVWLTAGVAVDIHKFIKTQNEKEKN